MAQIVFGLIAFVGFIILVPTQIWQAILLFILSGRLMRANAEATAPP